MKPLSIVNTKVVDDLRNPSPNPSNYPKTQMKGKKMTYDQIENMSSGEWLSYRADKLTAFYESGKELIPDPECKQCDVVNNYVCFDCEVNQIGE